MSQTHPWPPLEGVRRGLDSGDAQALGLAEDCGTHTPTGSTGADAPSSHADYLLLPLTELARRRAAVAARQFPATLAAGRTAKGAGLMINSSRAILYAGEGEDFAETARKVALETRDAINAQR